MKSCKVELYVPAKPKAAQADRRPTSDIHVILASHLL